MEFAQQVRNALEEHFQGSDAQGVTWEDSIERVGGLLLWKNFAPFNPLERQQLIFNFLRQEFDQNASRVSMIFAYSPEEYEIMQSV